MASFCDTSVVVLYVHDLLVVTFPKLITLNHPAYTKLLRSNNLHAYSIGYVSLKLKIFVSCDTHLHNTLSMFTLVAYLCATGP